MILKIEDLSLRTGREMHLCKITLYGVSNDLKRISNKALPCRVSQATASPSSLLPGSEALLCFSPSAYSNSALEGLRHKSPCSPPRLPLISSPSDSCYLHQPEHLFLTSPSDCCSGRGMVLRDQLLCSLPLLSVSSPSPSLSGQITLCRVCHTIHHSCFDQANHGFLPSLIQ